jgi:hypothetical protein
MISVLSARPIGARVLALVAAACSGCGTAALERARVTDALSGEPTAQDVWLAGPVEAAGVRWPRSLRLTQDSAPYFDLEITTLRVLARLEEPLLSAY